MGLGCSRFGSAGGASKDEARRLLHAAYDEGVRLFDTSNIYGQGDSERLIGEFLQGRSDGVVVSKAGKYVALPRRVLVPFKGLIRAAVRRSDSARQTVTSARARPMPTKWTTSHLTKSLEGSLTRLRRDRVEIFMLHSPPVDVILMGGAVTALDRARQAGKLGLVGVAVDDVDTAWACLGDDRISVIQMPLRPESAEFSTVVDAAHDAGVAVIAREILGGIGSAARHQDPSRFAHDRIQEVMQNTSVTLPIVGATRMTTLTATVEVVRSAT